MFSFARTAAYIFSKLASIVAGICSLFGAFVSQVPTVPTFLGGYDNGLLYALNPRAFLARSQEQCGPVYRVWIGSWRFKVISTSDAISAALSAPPDLLRNDTMHKEVFYVVAGVKTNSVYLHAFMVRELFPVDKALSQRSLGQTTHSVGLVLFSQVMKVVQDHSGPISIIELTNKPLYVTMNLLLLGDAFPGDTYNDFQTFSRTRVRLLRVLKKYLQQGEDLGHTNYFSRGFKKAFKDNNIQSMEGAQLVLNFLWGVHNNTLNNSLFLLSFLLNDPDAFARVRTEVDLAAEKFGGFEALLGAGPDELDSPSLGLLTSAIMETMRLTTLFVRIREAMCDFDLKVKDRIIPITKGEVLGNVHAVHLDPTVYPNPETFVVDRFAEHPYKRKHLQTEGYPFHSLGGGRHMCKGRWLAIYEMKLLFIILLHTFDFNPAEEGSVGWTPLRAASALYTLKTTFSLGYLFVRHSDLNEEVAVESKYDY